MRAVKASTIKTLNLTLAFHTSTNYQIQAPPPFDTEVHEDIVKDLARISGTAYSSDFALHLDFFASFRRLFDGHCVVLNLCYDSLYISYLPTPLVLLTAEDGSQHVHIAPEAFTVASAEFPDQIDFWQDALPGELKGQLATLSGARVLQINGEDPFIAVDQNALITGSFQSFGTRQNSFFSSYSRGGDGWSYIMGNFALQVHPLVDSVDLTIQRVNSSIAEQVTIPYRSRFGSSAKNFTDSESYRANNCVARDATNGLNLYETPSSAHARLAVPPIAAFEHQPAINLVDRKRPINVLVDATPLWDVELPEEMLPAPIPLNQSYSVAQFYVLDNDNTTGVLALGSFSAPDFLPFMKSLLDGLTELKSLGATKLIVDVTNNGGGMTARSLLGESLILTGYICIAHWLHRIIIGPKASTEPNAGLFTHTRAGPLAQAIVEKINKGADPDELLMYNPINWHNASNLPYTVDYHYLRPTINLTINGHQDAFSPLLGAECQPFEIAPPEEGLFKPEDVVIISNGRCASSCSLFSITMSKLEGVKTAVVGGKKETKQQYCGIVGGQSTNYASMDTEVKSTGLKEHELAPPDFITNSVMGITWRLGFGVDDPSEPEEWQDHPADLSLALTADTANKPSEIWKYTAKVAFGDRVAAQPGDNSQAHFSAY
uniref:Tail specific protease domain-containing protein n=1 Tax=Mycena chlorophos TaxID=658473 RepID=A0ABQ0M0H2_MYCCL|nr:predicted protein [Mycena chlorophos]